MITMSAKISLIDSTYGTLSNVMINNTGNNISSEISAILERVVAIRYCLAVQNLVHEGNYCQKFLIILAMLKQMKMVRSRVRI